jgi:hypothetical protein
MTPLRGLTLGLLNMQFINPLDYSSKRLPGRKVSSLDVPLAMKADTLTMTLPPTQE